VNEVSRNIFLGFEFPSTGGGSIRKIVMKLSLLPSAAIMLLAAGVTAHAADSNAMSGSNPQPAAKDSLSLSRMQERTAWRDLSRYPKQQTAASSFTPSIGATIPNEVTLRAMPQKAANQLPALRPYDFAVLQDKLLIVNPNDKKVVDVISRKA
jgi:hypothetical protein